MRNDQGLGIVVIVLLLIAWAIDDNTSYYYSIVIKSYLTIFIFIVTSRQLMEPPYSLMLNNHGRGIVVVILLLVAWSMDDNTSYYYSIVIKSYIAIFVFGVTARQLMEPTFLYQYMKMLFRYLHIRRRNPQSSRRMNLKRTLLTSIVSRWRRYPFHIMDESDYATDLVKHVTTWVIKELMFPSEIVALIIEYKGSALAVDDTTELVWVPTKILLDADNAIFRHSHGVLYYDNVVKHLFDTFINNQEDFYQLFKYAYWPWACIRIPLYVDAGIPMEMEMTIQSTECISEPPCFCVVFDHTDERRIRLLLSNMCRLFQFIKWHDDAKWSNPMSFFGKFSHPHVTTHHYSLCMHEGNAGSSIDLNSYHLGICDLPLAFYGVMQPMRIRVGVRLYMFVNQGVEQDLLKLHYLETLS